MSGRSDGNGANAVRGWIRGALVVVVIAGVLGAFGAKNRFRTPDLTALQIAGIAVMLASLALVALASRLAARFAKAKRERAMAALKLLGVALCAAGAALVFI